MTHDETPLQPDDDRDEAPAIQRVLVLGATGYIGGRLVPRLLEAGDSVRVVARHGVGGRAWAGDVDVVVGDVADHDVMVEACRDIDVLYYLVHGMSAGRGFEDADRRAAENVARAAAAASVSRIVYLGGLHPDVPADELSPHLRSRVEVGRILLGSGVPTIVLQAGVVIGSGSASFEMVRHLTDVLPYMPAPRWVRNRIQPIAVRDVLHYLLGAARVPASINRAFDIGGPDVLRYGQMMNGYAVAAGLPQRAIAALPVLSPRLASRWVGLVTPIPKDLAKPLVESLQHDCVVREHDIDDVIPRPAEGLVSYQRAVRLALGRVQADDVETSWQDAEVAGAPSDPLPSDPDWAGRTVYVDKREAEAHASVDAVWRVIQGIGGRNGWYSAPLLWAARGWMDRLVGGVGLARGRRSGTTAAEGDAIDFWRVERVEERDDGSRMLRLRAEMKVPGLAWLELGVGPAAAGAPDGVRSVYRQRAIFFPRGLAGRLYWFAVLPFHGLIFSGMAARIVAGGEGDS